MVLPETLAGACLSSSLSVLFDRLFSRAFLDLIQGNKEPLKRLKIVLLFVHAIKDDAEQKQHGNPVIRDWLHELKEAIYEAEDLLYEIEAEALRSQANNSLSLKEIVTSLNAFFTARKLQIESIIERLKILANQKDVLGLKEAVRGTSLQGICPAPLVDESHIFGRSLDKDAIIDLLQSENFDGDGISVVAIVGMGGVGKTTLAQMVYNDNRVQTQFAIRVWISVSDNFDVFGLTKRIFEAVTSQTCIVQELLDLQVQLKNALRGRKFLIVLDDLWNENYIYWDALKTTVDFGRSESRIIVTTRSEKAASILTSSSSIYQLQMISYQHAWLLFQRHAFNNRDPSTFQHQLDFGKRIVQRCKGLPLAVKSFCGILRNELNIKKWEVILNSEIWELPERENNILPSLLLSYFRLPSHIKACFAYCSIFEQGREMEKEQLISLWMAENLLQSIKGKRPEEIGREYIDILISRSLFQKSREGDQCVAMHNLVHDMARFVSAEFSLMLDGSDSQRLVSRTRYLACTNRGINAHDSFMQFQQLVSSENIVLRTFLSLKEPTRDLSKNKLVLPKTSAVKVLRVLSLACYQITSLDSSLSNLISIRYLNLSGNGFKEIPDNTITSLPYLQTLLLADCSRLIRLPKDIVSLTHLQHLDIHGTPIMEMPPDTCNMINLQKLSNFVLSGDTGSRIKDLGGLQHLHGSITISGLEHIRDIESVVMANLRDKKHLNRLVLIWTDGYFELQRQKQVLDSLEPHKNLAELVIAKYSGSFLSDWITDRLFSNLMSLDLNHCIHCSSLPPLGELPSLEILKISGFYMVEVVGEEFYSGGASEIVPFRSLKDLTFEDMLKWKIWNFVGRDGSNIMFPCIENISLRNCPKLSSTSLPTWIHNKLS